MDLAEHSGFTNWGDYKSNWITTYQMLVFEENRSAPGKSPQSRVENQQNQTPQDGRSGNRTRATLVEGDNNFPSPKGREIIRISLKTRVMISQFHEIIIWLPFNKWGVNYAYSRVLFTCLLCREISRRTTPYNFVLKLGSNKWCRATSQERSQGGPGVPETPLLQALFNQKTYNMWREYHVDILAIVKKPFFLNFF